MLNECGQQLTESLERSEDAIIDTTGIMLIGQQLVDGVYYEVKAIEIHQLGIIHLSSLSSPLNLESMNPSALV